MPNILCWSMKRKGILCWIRHWQKSFFSTMTLISEAKPRSNPRILEKTEMVL